MHTPRSAARAAGVSTSAIYRAIKTRRLPAYKLNGGDEEWHLASWVPNDPECPTVLMNREAPILLEAIKYHQQQYQTYSRRRSRRSSKTRTARSRSAKSRTR